MNNASILATSKLIGFAITTNPLRSIEFYRDILGFHFICQDQFAVVFDCNGNMLRLAILPEFQPPKYTVAGWQVDEIEAVVEQLANAGVKMMVYGFPGQAESGIWTAPDGNKVAWFQDPDGNLLSVSQHNS
jgi:catechol 2,3-dioxygenase-like lactoylglutathione lyase family enzyme